jgi:predicted P-loop ATPase
MQRLELEFSSDEFRHRKFVQGQVLQEYQGELTDDRCSALRNLVLKRFGFDPGRDHTRDALNMLCLENPHHPIRDYLDKIKWDGTSRLSELLPRYFGAENTPLNAAIGRIMLIAAVRRVRKPGCKFDTIAVLEGMQGTGKSTALSILAGVENFSDNDLLARDPKAQMEALEGIWIYEICELEGLSRADTGRVKAFASRQTDRARPAYGRFREDRQRQCIFVGTTNEDKYLRDLTGNRRWWPVKTGAIDLDALTADRDQLWAEAAHWEAKGEYIVLAESLWADAAREQEARLEDDPWTETLATVETYGIVVTFDHYKRVKTKDLFGTVLNIPPGQQKQFQAKQLAGLMRKLGWEGPRLLRFGGDSLRGYQKPIEPSANK